MTTFYEIPLTITLTAQVSVKTGSEEEAIEKVRAAALNEGLVEEILIHENYTIQGFGVDYVALESMNQEEEVELKGHGEVKANEGIRK